jgi:hypothetical protein
VGPSPVPGEPPAAPGQHDGPMRPGNPVPRQPTLTDALVAPTRDGPLLSVLYGCTGFRIEKTEPLDAAKELT